MNQNEYENSYQTLNENLAAFFNYSNDDISEEDLIYAYPITEDLRKRNTKYVEHEVIAEGGVKRIIRVTDTKSDRSVAKAVLLDNSTKENIEAFLREARLTSSLQHPNIIPVYDMGLDKNDMPFFIMEHLTGDTLGRVIQQLSKSNEEYQKRYSRSALLDIFSKICDALAYAHSRNVIHLDLKPDNIHINDYGQVHICDWGLGKLINADSEPETGETPDLNILNAMTLTGQVKGTPGYMAPEQATPGQKKDQQTDIYALGAILHSLLSYKIPVQGENLDEIIQNTKDGKLQALENDQERIPESLSAIVNKALKTVPSERYNSVQEMSRDIDKYRHGFATDAENAGFVTQLRLLIKRNKRTTFLIAAFCVVSLVAGIIAFKKINNEKRLALIAKEEAQKQQKKAEESLALYLKERKVTETQGKNIDLLIHEIARNQDLSKPEEQITILEQGLTREFNENQKKRIYSKLITLHFVLQNFNATRDYLKQLSGNRHRNILLAVCNKYAPNKKDGEILKDAELADIINYVSHNQRYSIPTMFYHHMKQTRKRERDPKEYWPLAKAMLKIVNNYWNTDPLDRELVPFQDGYSLDLSNTRYRIFRCHNDTFHVSIMGPLNLRKLNLSHTPFFEFWQLQGVKLKELNITGCWIREIHLGNLHGLKSMGLKKITIDTSLYTQESMNELKKHFKIIDRKK